MYDLRFIVAVGILAGAATPAFAQDAMQSPVQADSSNTADGKATPSDAGPAPAAATTPTTPDFTITGSAAVVSQYRFRGISQSDNKPVVQGAFTVAHQSGFYVSLWGSSATANDAVDLGGTEIDVYGGYTHTLGQSGVAFDGGLYGYIYPGSSHAVGASESYYEVYGSLAKPFGPVTTKAGLYWAPKQGYFDRFATPTRYSIYAYGELGLAVPGTAFSLHSHVGHTGGGLDYAGHAFVDYTAGAAYKWKALTFDVSVVGTDLSRRDTAPFDLAFATDDFRRAAKSVVVGSVTASF